MVESNYAQIPETEEREKAQAKRQSAAKKLLLIRLLMTLQRKVRRRKQVKVKILLGFNCKSSSLN